MASLNCFISYVQQAQQNAQFGILSKNELRNVLSQNGMTDTEIDEALVALNELFKARVKQVEGKRLSKQQKALVAAVYNGGTLTADQAAMMEDIAKVMEIPVISEPEMNSLKALAATADQREGSEKALIDEKIRNILDQKDPTYRMRLNSSKISFKVLLSVGFSIMSYISNQKKILEQYGIQRLRMQQAGKGLFSPYVLKDYSKYSNAYAKAMSQAVRGVTNESDLRSRFKANLGLAADALLGPTQTYGADVNAYSDALEHSTPSEKQGSKIATWWRATDRKLARTSKRWLSSIDTSAKVKMGEIFYFNEVAKKIRIAQPTLTDAEVMREVFKEMYSVSEADAIIEAERQFLDWGIVDAQGNVNKSSPRFKVRVAEIMRSGRDPETMKRAYETAAGKVWQNRMTFPSMKNDPYDLTKFQQRLDSGLGGIIADGLNGLKHTANNVVGGSMVGQGFVFSLFGFINGAAAYWQDFMEHNFLYGGGKLGRMMLMRNKDLTEEQREYLEEKIIEVKGKVMFGLIETGMIALLGVLANAMCKEEGAGTGGGYTDFVTPDKPMGADAVQGNVEMQRPESALSFCGRVSIPLEFAGGFSISNTKFIASLANQLENKDENFISAFLHAAWLTSSPTISPLMDKNPGAIAKIMEVWNKDTKAGQGYDNLYNVAQRELSYSISNMATRMLPIPQRIIRESMQPFIPYKTFAPAGIQGSPEQTLTHFMWQTGLQSVYQVGNLTGVNQLISVVSPNGLATKPVFDYRHRAVDLGNLYDGKSIAGLSKPFRDIVENVKGKDPILYDEKDHFLAVNDVNIPFDSRIYTVLHKKDDAKKRLLTDDEYYAYQYAYTKAFGEWFDDNYTSLTDKTPKDIRNKVTRELGDIKRSALQELESNSKLDGEELYKKIR